MNRLLVALIVSVVAVSAIAQPATEPVLIPVWWKGDLPGAFGSVWRVELSAVNQSATPVILFPYAECANMDACVLQKELSHDVTVYPPLLHLYEPRGFLLGVTEGRSKDVDFTLRVHDVSRGSLDWGTEIPVVRLAEALRGPVSLPDIPATPEFRSLLRIYLFDPMIERRFHVSVYAISRDRDPLEDDTPDPLLVETTLTLAGPELPEVAPYAAFSLRLPDPAITSRVRVEVVPDDSSTPYWAFVSVTHNETQRITTITP